jgi:hypothetical protein
MIEGSGRRKRLGPYLFSNPLLMSFLGSKVRINQTDTKEAKFKFETSELGQPPDPRFTDKKSGVAGAQWSKSREFLS